MYDGIVLAAGFSSRTSSNKMCLEYRNKPLILNTIETMHKYCKNIIVVTGHYHKQIEDLLSKFDFVKIAYNKDYKNGMFSSIRTGVLETKNSFFIIPGDYPSVREDTYKKLLETNKKISVPSHNMRLGHPIYFDQSFKEKILETDCQSLKDFRNIYDFEIIEVDDCGILLDIDNLNDYKELLERNDLIDNQ
jgi:molybdenum cofactor cytidylyltransferase